MVVRIAAVVDLEKGGGGQNAKRQMGFRRTSMGPGIHGEIPNSE